MQRVRLSGRQEASWGAAVVLAVCVGLYGCGATETEDVGGSSSQAGARPSPIAQNSDTIPPSIPTSVVARAVSPSQVGVSWSPSSDNVAVSEYRVYRDGVIVAAVGATSYQDSGLAASTTYFYSVRAVDQAGNVSWQSATVIVTTPATLDNAAPSTPTGLTASAISASRVDLGWLPSVDNVGVTGYRVSRNGTPLVTLGNVTSYVDLSVGGALTYIYTVQALDASGNVSGFSAPASATTPGDTISPTVPTGLVANAASTSQIALSWSAATDNVGVASYRIYRNTALIATLGNVTAFQDSGLSPSTTYTYNVAAADAAGNVSGLSTAASATTLAAPDTTPPSPPTTIVATAVSNSEIGLTWSGAADNVAVTGYRVFRNGVLVASLGSSTTYQDIGLAASTTYTYRVRAVDMAGNVSAQSAAASATTQAVPDLSPPTVPTGFTATTISSSRIDLSWTASTDNIAVIGYRIYRNGVLLATASGSATSYQSTGLSPGTMYAYYVDAIDGAGNASPPSAIASATTLAVNTATLAWDAVTYPSLGGYRVYYGTAPGVYLQPVGSGISVGNVTTFTVTGLTSGTRYYFVVTAFDTSNNESAFSNEVFKDIP